MNHFHQAEASSSRKKILLIDSQPIFRMGLQRLLADDGQWEIAGEAFDHWQGAHLAHHLQPDVIFLGLKHLECIAALRQLADTTRRPVIIVFSELSSEAARWEILQAGANACLPRRIPEPELALLLSQLNQEALPDFGVPSHPYDPQPVDQPGQWMQQLTIQQRRILALLATGKCNKRIGKELGISEGTVKVHLKSLYKKMNCNGRTQAIGHFLREPAHRHSSHPLNA